MIKEPDREKCRAMLRRFDELEWRGGANINDTLASILLRIELPMEYYWDTIENLIEEYYNKHNKCALCGLVECEHTEGVCTPRRQ